MDSLQECVSTAAGWLERQQQRFEHPALRAVLDGARRGDSADSPRPFMVGSFSGHEIAHVMEHLAGMQAAGTLTVCDGSRWTVLWFEGGRIVHAESMEKAGRDAVRVVVNLTQGWYLFLAGTLEATTPRTLPASCSVTGLLLDILRELDEQRADRRANRDAGSHPRAEAPLLDLALDDLLELRKVADGLRDAHMRWRRAELDSWFYREHPSRAARHREAEERAQSRLFQWLASRSAFAAIDALRDAGSVKDRLELLDVLIAQAGERSLAGPGSAGGEELGVDQATWSVLEEED